MIATILIDSSMERSCLNGRFESKIDFVKLFLQGLYSNENQEQT